MKFSKIASLTLILLTTYVGYGQFDGNWSPIQSLRNKSNPEKISVNSLTQTKFLKNENWMPAVYSVLIDNIAMPSAILNRINKWQDVAELFLMSSGQDLTKQDFENLAHIEHLILKCSPYDSALLVNAASIPYLEKLTLIFDEQPENWDFLHYYKNIKSLHVYGNYLPESFSDMAKKLRYFHQLVELGLSIDYATDLPRSLNFITSLKILRLYDNNTRLNYQNNANVQAEKFNVVGQFANDQAAEVSVFYYADDYGLTFREVFYLQQVWNGKQTGYIPLLPTQKSRVNQKQYTRKVTPTFASEKVLNPLVEGLFPESEVFTVHSNQSTVLHTKSGFNIFIPQKPNQYLTADGRPYEGNVYYAIKRMPNLLDIAFRGMDLKVTNHANSPLFNTAFAFEIQLSDGVFPLKFDERSQVRIEFPNQDTIRNVYYYDVESKSFMDYNLFKMVNKPDNQFEALPTKSFDNHTYALDMRSFEDRFNDPENFFLLDEHTKSEKYIKNGRFFTHTFMPWKKEKESVKLKNIRTVKQGRKLVGIKKLNPKRKQKDAILFQLQDKSELFEECKILRKVLFKYADTMTSKEFSANFMRNKLYHDFRIQKLQNKFELTLKTEDAYHSIGVDQILYKLNGKPYSTKASQKIMTKFWNMQMKRGESFDDFLQIKEADYAVFYKKRQADWEKKDQFQHMHIAHSGIFSVMQIGEQSNHNVNFHITYTDNNGLPIDVKKLIVIDKKNGSVRTINKGNVSLDVETLSLLLCVDYKGNLYYLEGDALRGNKLTPDGIYYIRLNSIQQPRSMEEFHKAIKFDRMK